MVNTHRKFPIDAKHNAYYAADGSDFRDATEDEVVKYRLAAAHKQKKPDVELSCDKSESVTAMAHEERRDSNRSYKRNVTRRRKDSPRDGKKDHGSRNREAEGKGGRTSSHDSRGNRDATHRDHGRTDSKRREGGGVAESRTSEREEKGKGEGGEIDVDERDRCQMAEIQRGMEERKTAKDLEGARATMKELKSSPWTTSVTA